MLGRREAFIGAASVVTAGLIPIAAEAKKDNFSLKGKELGVAYKGDQIYYFLPHLAPKLNLSFKIAPWLVTFRPDMQVITSIITVLA